MKPRDTMVRGMAAVGTTALAMLATAPACAQATASRATREYVQAAGQSDAFEMREAETALAQSSDPQVIAFAHRMLQDHARLSQTLAAATAKAGTDAPAMGVGADLAPLLGALQSVRGPDFDRAYWRQQALAHQSALTTTQQYAANGDDPVIRQEAAAAVPVITAHLTMAQQMQTKSGS